MTEKTIEKISGILGTDPASIAGSAEKGRKFRDDLEKAIDAADKEGASKEFIGYMYEIGTVAGWLEIIRPGDSDYRGCAEEFRNAVRDATDAWGEKPAKGKSVFAGLSDRIGEDKGFDRDLGDE